MLEKNNLSYFFQFDFLLMSSCLSFTQDAPFSLISFFQNGASVLRKSIINSHALNALPLCLLETATPTIRSLGSSFPTL